MVGIKLAGSQKLPRKNRQKEASPEYKFIRMTIAMLQSSANCIFNGSLRADILVGNADRFHRMRSLIIVVDDGQFYGRLGPSLVVQFMA